MNSDGKPLHSRAHTLTRATLAEGADGIQFVLDFAAIRVGIILKRGSSPLEVISQLRAMGCLIEAEFCIENDTNQATTKSHTRYGAQKTQDTGESELCSDCPPPEFPDAPTRCLPCPRRRT